MKIILNTMNVYFVHLEKDSTQSSDEALVEIYKNFVRQTTEGNRNLFDNLFFDPRRYDLARVGRYKLIKN